MPLEYERPGGALAGELAEVANCALELRSALRSVNFPLPRDFPVRLISTVIEALIDLPNGTAEGCRIPLEYARFRLPAIRREFFQHDGEPGAIDQQTPLLLRGHAVDISLRNTITATVTALDEYHRQGGGGPVDDIGRTADSTLTRVSTDRARYAMEQLEGGFRQSRHSLNEHLDPSSVSGDKIKRQLNEASHLARLIQVEIESPAIFVRLYRLMIAALRKVPAALRATASALRLGADILGLSYNRWHEFKRNFTEFCVTEVKRTCDVLDQVADRLEWKGERPSDLGDIDPLNDATMQEPISDKSSAVTREIGKALQEARVAEGMTIKNVSEALNISNSQILAIEQGNLHRLPPRVYLLGWIRSYAQLLRLDLTVEIEALKKSLVASGRWYLERGSAPENW